MNTNTAPLRAGTQTGSFVNYMMSGGPSPTPSVGMGVTLLFWTDRKPATITTVHPNGKTITIQEDKAIRTDKNGMSDAQSYTFERNTQGRTWIFTLRKNGAWVQKGDSMNGLRLHIGTRDRYYDYSF